MVPFYLAATVGGVLALATQISAFVTPAPATPAVERESAVPVKQIVAINIDSAKDLSHMLGRVGFDLEQVRAGADDVPALYVASLPHDLGSVPQVDRKKKLFFSAVLPLVLRVNESVARDRVKLIRFRDRLLDGAQLRSPEFAWLLHLANRYEVLPADAPRSALDSAVLDELLLRVDEVPTSLALAQAAVESGWGSSRFAKHGNALFGQRAWSESAGIAPTERGSDEVHVVRSYRTLLGSVRSYVRNLNTHESYADFRRFRAKMRVEGEKLDSTELAGHLLAYAEIGEAYVSTLRTVIEKNRLKDFDGAVLERRLALASN